MCKKVNTKMALGYALKDRSSVSENALQKMRNKLAGYKEGIAVDVSLSSLIKAARRYEGAIRIVGEHGTFRVEKDKGESFPAFFSDAHLRDCYAALYTPQEYDKIVSVLTSMR